MSVEIGKIVGGKVSGITNFGAFVDLGDGKTGLVHISEVSNEFVKDIKSVLKEGQEIKVKVVSVEKNGKIGLSIKQIEQKEQKNRQNIRHPEEFSWGRKGDNMSFEDKMLRFKQDSDEKMHDIKRNVESKRGSNYKRG